MLGAAKKKLHSRQGASMSIALLLFLVCLAVSSVVLTAGTAAAGRLSELKKMDQRYYSVTSAAELVRDMVSSETVGGKTVPSRTVTFTQTKTTQTSGGGTTSAVHTDIGDSLLSEATARLTFGSDTNTMDAWLLTGGEAGDWNQSFDITSDKTLKVTVKAVIENGDLVFYFKNAENGATDAFCLKLTCTPEAPKAGAATAETPPEGETERLTRTVSVTYQKKNCVIERTGNW